MAEDEFEKIMDGELEEPKDEPEDEPKEGEGEKKDAATGEPSDEEGKDKEGETEDDPQPSPEDRLANLEKENKGRLRALKSERTKRQELESEVENLKGRLSQITDMVAAAKGKKAEAAEEGGEAPKGEGELDKIPISFDDEGNPFVEKKYLKDLGKTDLKEIEEQLDEIRNAQGVQATRVQISENVKTLLSTNEAYPAALNRLQSGFVFLDKALQDLIDENGFDKPRSLSEALEIIEGSPDIIKEFNKMLPGADLDLVVESMGQLNKGIFDQRKLRKVLNSVKATEEGSPNEEKKGLDKTVKFLAKKASNLGGVSNQKGKGGSTLDDYADMTVDDFMGLSDAQVSALEKQLADEEIQA